MSEVGHSLNADWRAPPALQPRPSTFAPLFPLSQPSPAPASVLRAARTAPDGGLHTGIRFGRRMAIAASLLAGLGLIATLSGDDPSIFDRDRLASSLGFGVEQVALSGHRFTADADLFAALDLDRTRSLVSFDPAATRARFERLPWVQSAEITRVWPGQLNVRVTERAPFAIWEQGTDAYLIDAGGRVLGPVSPAANLELPRLAGEGAPPEAAGLLATLDRHPSLKARLARAERVGNRRWTLVLQGGTQLLLPANGEASALARIAGEPALLSALEKPGHVIDMRAPHRIAVRSAQPGRSAPAGSQR